MKNEFITRIITYSMSHTLRSEDNKEKKVSVLNSIFFVNSFNRQSSFGPNANKL